MAEEVHTQSAPVRLARRAIEEYVLNGIRVDDVLDFPDLLTERAASFVSLHEHDSLRGCIGTLEPARPNLAEEIVENAIKAAIADPRFPEVRPEELPHLRVKVDVLHEPEEVTSLDELDPERYGVIVTSGWRRGVLLPDLDGVDTVEQQVAIAMRKAGIGPGEKVRLERFTVDRYT